MRDVNSLPGLHKLRTLGSTRQRSIPRIQGSTYLDLYMMGKEKERLLKEDERLCMRKDAIKKRVEEIDFETRKLQEAEELAKAGGETSPAGHALTEKEVVKKEWKKMSLSY